MAVKVLFSVSLLFWLLLFCCDCGLQGVKASPFSKMSANRLDELRSLQPKKISFINKIVSDNHEGQRGIEIAELLYDGVVITNGIPSNSTLSVTYLDGWIIEQIYGDVYWFEGEGNVWLIIGEENDNWSIAFETFEWVLGYAYELVVVLYRLTPDKITAPVEAERIPVEQTFRFDDKELKVKAPSEIRQEINYSKQRN